MVRKKREKVLKKTSSRKKPPQKKVGKFEKNMKNNLEGAEKWIIARKKFFIKLGWVLGIIIILLILSHIYLRVEGMGL